MSAPASDLDDAARAAAALAAAEELQGIEASVLVDLALAGMRAGGEVVAREPATHAVVAALEAGDLAPALALAEPARVDVLLTLAEVLSPQPAGRLADALLECGPIPLSPRLAAVLGLADATRCSALLGALAQEYGAGSPVVAEAVVEVVVAAADAGAPPPAAAAALWDELTRGAANGTAGAEIAVGRLRLEARRDAGAAVPLLAGTVDAVGAEGAEIGADAVLGRLGAADPRARTLLTDERLFPEERALLLRAAAWETTAGVDAGDVAMLVEALRSQGAARETAPAAHHLLALAARLGDAEVAAAVVSTLGPAPWAAWNATWAPARKRGGQQDPYLNALADVLADSPPGLAAAPGPAPAWASLGPDWQREYVRLKALPALELPWWRPWGGGLP